MKNKTLFIYLCSRFFNLTIIEKEMEAKETLLILGTEMEKELQKGIEDYHNGNYLTQEELNKELKEWIKE